MARLEFKNALIVGAGVGLSASLARLFAKQSWAVSLAARTPGGLEELCDETGAKAYACDASSESDVAGLFNQLDDDGRTPDLVVYNPSARQRAPFLELDAELVKNAILVTAYGGFLVAQEAATRMVPNGSGAILFTGASASVKGYPMSAPFAMGKFALRGLAQSMARELAPRGIHVAHFVIDGGIRNPNRPGRVDAKSNPDTMLDPDVIAETYLQIAMQDKSAWTWEVELRPWVENF
ncbi:MAG: SDR family NAD(P)-dependent oxidoreductase [Hyphomicrobiales bacterium]